MASIKGDNDIDSSPLLNQTHADHASSHNTAPSIYRHERDGSDDLAEYNAVEPASALDHAVFQPPPHVQPQSDQAESCAGAKDLKPYLPALATQLNVPRLEDIRLSPRESHRLSIKGKPARARSLDTGQKPKSDIGRSRSLLQVLSPSAIRQNILSPREHYSTIHELDELNQEDHVEVDISLLEGPETTTSWPQGGTLPGTDPVPSSESQAGPDPGLRTGTPLNRKDTTSHISRNGIEDTVRQYGQQLADERKMIVSVKESAPAVDLSTLEGTDRRMSKNSFSFVNQAAFGGDEASFFYPTDPEKPNWQPFSMKIPYILMLIIVSLVLAAVQEYLYQQSKFLEARGQGLIEYNRVVDIPVAEFFAWKYLPTMVMVIFGVLWQLMEYNVKRLEPYYQLSQPTGNTAAKSLNLDYVSMVPYLVPFKAIKNGHWTVAVASIGAMFATTAAPSLQNPSITSIRNPKCKDTECFKAGTASQILQVNAVWSRLVTVTLVLVAAMAVVLLFQLRRKSGLLSDPKGIGGIASMATKSHILNDFQGMDEATERDIHKKLRHRRYVLYKSSIWQGEYMRHADELNYDDEKQKVQSPHPIILRLVPGITFLAYLTFLVAAIPVVGFTVNSITLRAPWLPVLLAVVVKQLWSTLEFAVRMLEPYFALSRGNARPEKTLTLDYQGTPYGVVAFQAIFNRHYMVALAGLGSVLSDVLTVTASSLSMQDETAKSFTVSCVLSTTVTFFLLCSAALIWFHRRHAFLPRQPSTIASVLAFIHQSRMLDDFVNTERFSNDKMRTMLMGRNKRYGLGWFRGRDGKPHCGIDEEPMLSKYVHGVSYRKAQAPWEDSVGF
ncbi:hypothetical protein PISL3812_09616 [Talaromyces islandicus]|uniref:Uncharacterized protein n=1 Tax=Talaromyces islandicus TaxID=28573 RepID=A0A0U1MA70_TALIS|nr:hypothetical protein PISL3812_09616 [Talaromyces islandicus]